MPTRLSALALAISILRVTATHGDEKGVIASMDEMKFQSPKEKGSAALVDGKVGKAIRFRFEKDARSTFFTSNIHARPVGSSRWILLLGQGGRDRWIRGTPVHLS